MSELSRSSRNLVIVTTSVFILLTLFTLRRDGGVAVGYPWAFYTYSSVGDHEQRSVSWSMQPQFLVINWLLIAAVLLAINEGIKKIRRKTG